MAMAGRCLFAALAAASLAHLVQMAFSWVPGYPASAAFFASHLLVVTVIHLGAMLVLAGRRDNRPWAAAVFAVPVALALWPCVGTIIAIVFALACVGLAAWSPLARGRGAPLVAGVAGAVGGVGLLGFWHRDFMGLGPLPGVVVTLGVAAVGALVVIRCSRYVPAAVAVPSSRNSVLTAALACLAGLLVGRVGVLPYWPVPPASVPTGVTRLPPVVLVVLDTVRAHHLRLYGYQRDTMPYLERFARDHTVIAERARSDAPATLPTHASIFTGLHSPRHGAHYPGMNYGDRPPFLCPLREDVPTLAGLLADAGYWSVAISANCGQLDPVYGCDRGFHIYRAVRDMTRRMKFRSPWRLAVGGESPLAALDRFPPFAACDFFGCGSICQRAESITDQGIEILNVAGGCPLFLFINYVDAHQPYCPPRAFLDRFPGRIPGLWPCGVPRQVRSELRSGQRELTAEERVHLVALYDSELAYLDSQLKRLLERLRQHPRWEEMLLVVVGDHGEAFGEHQLFEHGFALYEELLRVPLFLKPGSGAGRGRPPTAVLSGPIQTVDIFATVLEHVGLHVPADSDGRPWGRGRTQSVAYAYTRSPNTPECPERFKRDLRMVERDGWKLIESTEGMIELYDLANDPEEQHNLADQRPELRDSLLALLGQTEWPTPASDRQLPVETEDTLEKLRALGYVE